jgi:D-alanyl-D-alanine carboxypeptidase
VVSLLPHPRAMDANVKPQTLRQKQNRFAGMVGRLLLRAQEMGYEVTLGEAYRTPEQAAFNAQKGTGIRNSLHSLRLAIDLNLFLNGAWLIGSDDHRPLGEWWESIGGSWGGNFKRPDGGHYSLEHEGRR